MKIPKVSLIALLAAASLLSQSSSLKAQDDKKDSKPPAGQPATPPSERPRPGGPGGGFSAEDRFNRLSEQLALTDDQKPKVKALLEAQDKHRGEWRDLPPEERREKAIAAREEMNKKMKEILTEEQFKKYEALPRGRGPGGPGGPRPGAGPESGTGDKKPDAPKP